VISVIKDRQDYNNLIQACEISKKILRVVVSQVKEGNTPFEINELTKSLCKQYNCKPAFFGVKGPKGPFPGYLCISTNDEVLHGVPLSKREFKSGDVVKVDFGLYAYGMYTDHCVNVIVGDVSEQVKKLVEISKLCIEKGIENAISGGWTGDISNAMETVCKLSKVDFVKTFCGHGIGKKLHMDPEVLTYGERGTGTKLIEGMVLTIENQITSGSADLYLDKDGWTLKTKDGSLAFMTEHMIIIRKKQAEVLTRI